MFKKIGDKKDMCVFGICNANRHTQKNSVFGAVVLLGSKYTNRVSPLFWKSGIIRRVCISPKVAETRALMRVVVYSTIL